MPTSLTIRCSFASLVLLLTLGGVGCSPDSPSGTTLTTATTQGTTAPTQQEERTSQKVEFLVFSAKWCSVCRDVPPVLTKLRAAFPDVTIRELDVDEPEAGKLAAEYEADALPYYFVRVDGKVVARRKGFLPYEHAEKFLREARKSDEPVGERK